MESSTPPLPLTLDSIAAVLRHLKGGQYRYADDYMSVAKDKHLAKFEWDTMLGRQARVCVRSTLRGIGPSHHCGEIPLDGFVKAATELKDSKLLPVGFARAGTLAYFFCLRELELGDHGRQLHRYGPRPDDRARLTASHEG